MEGNYAKTKGQRYAKFTSPQMPIFTLITAENEHSLQLRFLLSWILIQKNSICADLT